MINMAAMPIYCKKTLKIFSLETSGTKPLKLYIQHWCFEPYSDCSNDDHGLTLTFFTARSDLMLKCF